MSRGGIIIVAQGAECTKCQKVADAFAELYEVADIVVLDVGRYGFVMLKYYMPPYGFEEDATSMDSRALFERLWQEWIDRKLYYLIAKGTPLMEKDIRVYLKVCHKKNSRDLWGKKIIL